LHLRRWALIAVADGAVKGWWSDFDFLSAMICVICGLDGLVGGSPGRLAQG